MLRRLELPDGQWVDILVKPRHAEYLAIVEAAEDAATGNGTWARWALTVGQEFTKAWHVRGEDGQPLPVDDWSDADPDITDAICTEAQNRWKEWSAGRVPFVTPRPSPARSSATPASSSAATSAASPSTSSTTPSPTPSSSRPIRRGRSAT